MSFLFHYNVAAGKKLAHSVISFDFEIFEDQPFTTMGTEYGHSPLRYIASFTAIGAVDVLNGFILLDRSRCHGMNIPYRNDYG